MASIEVRAAKIIVDNAHLLHEEQHKHSLKVHIDRSREDGKWTMSGRKWVGGDEVDDDDLPLGGWTFFQLKNVVLEDVWDALAIKEMVIDTIIRARNSSSAYEHVLSISMRDEEFAGPRGGIGFHADRYPGNWE